MRQGLSLALLAAVVVVIDSVPTTTASYSTSIVNTAPVTTQAVFPPLNTTLPTIGLTLGGAVTSLTAGVSLTATTGTWSTAHVASTTYAVQWQRCAGSSCADIAGATALVRLVTADDEGSKLRVKVTATDSDTSVTPRNSMVAYSAEVP